jgi:hypothetical protein
MTEHQKHADAFLNTIDFSCWNYDANKKGNQFESDKRVRFDLSGGLSNAGMLQNGGIMKMKNNDDDLFEEDDESPKGKNKDLDDDIFGDDPVDNKKKEDSEDDIFGGDNIKEEEKKGQIGEDIFDDDDPFADEPKSKEKAIKLSQDRITKAGETEKEEDMKAGDLFSKNPLFNLLENKDKKLKPSIFGEIKDAPTLYSMKRDAERQVKDILKMRKDSPFDFIKTDRKLSRMVERIKITDIKTQRIIEKKIFSSLSLYNFYNKQMDNLEKLLWLPTKNSLKPSQEIIEKIELVVDTEK